MKKCPSTYITSDIQNIFESLPGLYLILNRDFTIVAVSDAYLSATMIKREAILNRGIFDVFPDNPADPDATGVKNLSASLNRVLHNKKPDSMSVQKYDIPVPESKGGGFETKFWKPLNSPVLDENGEVKYIIHQVEDVTVTMNNNQKEIDHKRLFDDSTKEAESVYLQNIKESEDSFRLLVENVKDYAIFLIDPDGCIVSWNKGAEFIKGYTAKEILGKHISVFYTNEEIEKKEPWHNLRMAREKGRFENEGWRVRKDGSKFWADVILTSLYNSKGDLKGFAKITRDITERKNAEDMLRKSNERFLKIFSLSPEAKVISEVDTGCFLYVNEAFTKMFGITEKEAVGKTASELNMLSVSEHKELAEKIEQGIKEGMEIKLRSKEGIVKEILVNSEVVELDGKRCFFTNYIDITERKKAERKIEQLNKDLQRNLEQLEASNKELESFSYSVSHDLRAPLRSINGYSQVLLEDYNSKLDEEGQKTLDRIMNNSLKMGRLIDDLLSFSRIGRKELQKEHVDMNEIVRSVLSETSMDRTNRDIDFVVHPLNYALADVSLIRHVWANLISNAIKYTRIKKEAIIEIGCEEKEEETMYYIKDNGAGFDMKYYDKLFGVFQRLHSEREFEGTGVGLAIVQRIIVKHEGRVWANAEVNKGATFYFSLPKNN